MTQYHKIVLILGVFVLFVNAEMDEEMKKIHQECLDVSKVDTAILEKAEKGEFVEDDSFKKYLLCFTKKIVYLNDDGDVDPKVVRSYLKENKLEDDEIEKVVTKCAVKKETPEDSAFYMISCVIGNTPDNIKFEVHKSA